MRILRVIAFLLGIILLTLDVVGIFKTMRNQDLYSETDTGRLNDITIKLEDAGKELKRKTDESDKAFALRVNDVVSKSMMHYWKIKGAKKYNLRVPVWENYILWLNNSFKSDKRYEFINYRKNLERGVGLCSTQSIVVKGVLLDNGVEAHLWDIAGHVVVRARVSDREWYILDPDFGIVVPYDIQDIESDPEIVRPAYANMAELYKPDYNDPYTTDHVVEIYGRDGNHIYSDNPAFEKTSYIAVWCIPLILIVPLSLDLRKKRKLKPNR
jgi:hypothetical protein